MTEQRVFLQPAFILQRRNYRETSVLLDVLTQDFGRIPLVANGVRKLKSNTAGLLQPFHLLSISWAGKAELKTLTHVEMRNNSPVVNGLAVYSAFYMNELLSIFLHQYDPHPEVFTTYYKCLLCLTNHASLERVLRIFEYQLLVHTGYGLALEYETATQQALQATKKYRFSKEHGLLESVHGNISGAALHALKKQHLTDARMLLEAKLFMRSVIDSHLQGRTLKSREVIKQIYKKSTK
ncbi:MAG: DNA repair protein RecO [Methylovulum sp.]|jgi:DNA repair protein RecO (recombination protein O)